MTYLEQITEQFPIRRSDEQKTAFRKWVMGQMASLGYRARVEENDKGKHKNIVVGSPESAQMTITAHYDTPACIGIPNLMIPRNWAIYFLYQVAVIGGMLPEGGARTYDYMKDEAFLFDNARITAEGALMLLGAGLEGTLYDADVAIMGMGRIAECLCRMLCALGVRTTVYARRPEVLSRARALGAKTVCFSGTLPPGITSHDALCNTVPHVLFDEGLLSQMKKSMLLVELASAPGGFDMEAVGRHGLHVVNGQGIPGKYAPRAASRLIADYTVKALKGEREYE